MITNLTNGIDHERSDLGLQTIEDLLTRNGETECSSLGFEQLTETSNIDIVAFVLGPGIGVRVRRVDRTNRVGRHPSSFFEQGEIVKRAGGYYATKIKQHGFNHPATLFPAEARP